VNVINHSDFKHKTTIALNPYYFAAKVIPKSNQTVSEKGTNANINTADNAKQYRQSLFIGRLMHLIV
jgi:hypothetical protein